MNSFREQKIDISFSDRNFVDKYNNRPPFNRKFSENSSNREPRCNNLKTNYVSGAWKPTSPQSKSPIRSYKTSSGSPPSKSPPRNYKTSNFFTGFHHTAYIENIQKQKQNRSRSTSPNLPKITYLRKNLPPSILTKLKSTDAKKLKDNWNNVQIKKSDSSGHHISRNTNHPENLEEFPKNHTYCKISEEKLKCNQNHSQARNTSSHVLMKNLLSNLNLHTKFFGNIEPGKTPQNSNTHLPNNQLESNCKTFLIKHKEPNVAKFCTVEHVLDQKVENRKYLLSEPKRSNSVPIRKSCFRKCRNPKELELFNPNYNVECRPKPPNRPPGRKIIEGIKEKVFHHHGDFLGELSEEEAEHMRFPKETRNAMANMLSKRKEENKHDIIVLHDSVTQTSPTESKISVVKAQQYAKKANKIPCPKNLLCEKGLHAGKCGRLIRPKEKFLRKREIWPGHTQRIADESKIDISQEAFLRIMEPRRTVDAIDEIPKELLNPEKNDALNTALELTSSAVSTTLSTMNGLNGHTNGDLNGCGDIITQNQQKGCWTIGLINSKFRYLTAETFGFKINANGASLKKKQIWTLEPDHSTLGESMIYLRSHLDKYLAVDSFGNITCESEEKDPGSKFQISVAEDGSGRWALKNVVRGYFLGSTSDKLTCTAKVPGDAEYWHVHLAARPQVNLRSVGRKRFAHLSENLDEIHVDANIPWGEDTLFTLEFRADEGGKYALHTCNNKYLSNGGKLVDNCTKDCLFSAEYHSGQLALRDRNGAYLSPIGSKAVLKTRSQTVTKDELFSLEDSLPQASFVAALNSRFVSVKQGVDVTANQDEISDHETFQLEFDWSTKRWYIRTMQDKYWTLETGGGIQAAGDKRSSNALFDLVWQLDGSVAFRANNGRYVMTKRSGHLYATSDAIDENCKYFFYLVNRPILVLKCEQGFVGHKSSSNPKLECNKATYETIQVERAEKGVVYFKGQNSKYWHADSESVTADSDVPEGFYLELREPTRLCIKSIAGNYLTASKNGCFRLGDSSIENATQWEY